MESNEKSVDESDPQTSQRSQPSKQSGWFKNLSVFAAAFVIIVVTAMLLQVDDFSRDFVTNFAETSLDAKDETLRPLEIELEPTAVQKLVEEAARRLSNWELVETATEEGEIVLHFERSTSVLRFVDDVTVALEDISKDASLPRTRLHVSSQSRVGKGDLGQNPRNIRELNQTLEALTGGEL